MQWTFNTFLWAIKIRRQKYKNQKKIINRIRYDELLLIDVSIYVPPFEYNLILDDESLYSLIWLILFTLICHQEEY